MSWILSLLKEHAWYFIFFLIGLACAMPYSLQQIHEALEIVGVLMMVALFASLLVPFQAFAHSERHKKWVMQNAPLIGFGAYAMAIIHDPTAIKIVVMLSAMAMHISYWTCGIHSRNYRLEQLRFSGLAEKHPAEMERIARLNANGRSDEADVIVRTLLKLDN